MVALSLVSRLDVKDEWTRMQLITTRFFTQLPQLSEAAQIYEHSWVGTQPNTGSLTFPHLPSLTLLAVLPSVKPRI